MRQIASQLRSNPCAVPASSLFKRGIATQVTPKCDAYCDVPPVGTPTWKVTTGRTLDTSNWIRGWILNQLSTRAAVTCDETPLGIKTGGFWGDAFRNDFSGFRSGSKLWSLQWSKTINETLQTARRYAEDALAYLTAWKIVDTLTVDVAYVSKRVLMITVTVTGPTKTEVIQASGEQLPDFGWLWREYRPTARSAA